MIQYFFCYLISGLVSSKQYWVVYHQCMMAAYYWFVAIALLTNSIGSEGCDSLYLRERNGAVIVYRDTAAPENASKSLSACGRWCIENPSCVMLSWSPGSCWQVGYCGTQIVKNTVYNLMEDRNGSY